MANPEKQTEYPDPQEKYMKDLENDLDPQGRIKKESVYRPPRKDVMDRVNEDLGEGGVVDEKKLFPEGNENKEEKQLSESEKRHQVLSAIAKAIKDALHSQNYSAMIKDKTVAEIWDLAEEADQEVWENGGYRKASDDIVKKSAF